jgi:uroporphyrinogen-III synthase
MKPVLLLREARYHRESQKNLRPLKSVCVAPYRFVSLPVKLPEGTFDFAIVSSAQTLKHLKARPSAAHWVFVGEASRRSFGSKSAKTSVLKRTDSNGILQFFKKQKPSRIFFPRSREADRSLVRRLRDLGHRVRVVHPYGLRYSPLRSSLKTLFLNKDFGAIFLSSPSCFEALRKSFSLKELRSWPLSWVVIGPTTQAALARYRVKSLKAPQASLQSMRDHWIKQVRN